MNINLREWAYTPTGLQYSGIYNKPINTRFEIYKNDIRDISRWDLFTKWGKFQLNLPRSDQPY